MEIKDITSYEELTNQLKNKEKVYLLIYKSGSDLSECALKNIHKIKLDNIQLFGVDVIKVRDIHTKYNITSAPTLVSFENGEYKGVLKGCNHPDHYKSYFESAIFISAGNEEKPQKSVTVYSTPTCSWCTTLKTYLKKNGIRFRDVDVSKDQSAAKAMVRKSGQQGVPQTEINGQMIVGFDKVKINNLLGI